MRAGAGWGAEAGAGAARTVLAATRRNPTAEAMTETRANGTA